MLLSREYSLADYYVNARSVFRAELGLASTWEMARAGFDIAFFDEPENKEDGFGHAFVPPLGYLTPRLDLPVIPILVNCYYPPQLIQSREDIAIAKKIIGEMSWIRLHMRNEQFSGVLPERRIDEISEGSISSLSMEKMLRSCSKTTDDWFHLYREKAKPLSVVSIS